MINRQYEEQQSHPMGDHADAFVNRIAHSIGFYAARTYLRIQDFTHTIRKETYQQDLERAGQTESSTQRSEQATTLAEEEKKPVTSKAEEKLDNLVQRLSSLTTTLKFNVQRTAARAREDAEDIWAEAQNIRYHQREPLPL